MYYEHSFHSRTTVISAHPGGCFYKLVTVLSFPFSQMDRYIFFSDFAFIKYYDIFFDFLFRLTDKALLMPGTFPGALMYHALHHATSTSTFRHFSFLLLYYMHLHYNHFLSFGLFPYTVLKLFFMLPFRKTFFVVTYLISFSSYFLSSI